jgi:hypothetical protein
VRAGNVVNSVTKSARKSPVLSTEEKQEIKAKSKEVSMQLLVGGPAAETLATAIVDANAFALFEQDSQDGEKAAVLDPVNCLYALANDVSAVGNA